MSAVMSLACQACLKLRTTSARCPLGVSGCCAVRRRRRAEDGFPGATTVCRHFAEGPPTKRIGLLIAGRLPAREGAPVYDGETQVGTVTSGGFSPSLQQPIAMGYVSAASAAAGTTLQIEVRGKRLDAVVTPMPFVPHRYVRKGG